MPRRNVGRKLAEPENSGKATLGSNVQADRGRMPKNLTRHRRKKTKGCFRMRGVYRKKKWGKAGHYCHHEECVMHRCKTERSAGWSGGGGVAQTRGSNKPPHNISVLS